MIFKGIFVLTIVFGAVFAQNYKVCIISNPQLCQALEKGGSQAVCELVESRVDCAIKLARGSADIGVFSEEEVLLLAQQQPNDNRVVATIRDQSRQGLYAFEAVAVVPSSHIGGFEGLRGGRYCHPGLDTHDLRWSPRVLKTLEQLTARTDRCPSTSTDEKTAEELEVETLNGFFAAACRPGRWSANATVDANLKLRYNESLCSLCGENNSCAGYTIDMGVSVSGVNNNNRHIQSLECLRRNGNGTVAYVAWQHVREFFNIRNPQDATSYSLLCEDGNLRPLTVEALANETAPCSLVKQPWSAIVASSTRASSILTDLRTWWPNGNNPNDNSVPAVLYNTLVGGSNALVVFEDSLPSPANYTSGVRNITNVDATSSCLPARRWCTLSAQEQAKCSWIRTAAYSLGIQPTISCQQRANVFDCLRDIKDNAADFISVDSNYGYLARQNYKLSPVKLVQNSRAGLSRIAALVKETSAQTDVNRFENLRDKKACFPEFGGIAYVAFVRAAHERSIISESQCDYARAVGEFFEGACAPGALDEAHALSDSSGFNTSSLCSVCKSLFSVPGNWSDFTCAWDYTNLYYGNNGSLNCLSDNSTHVAFVEMQNINAHLTSLGLQASQFRALCRNNTLAATTGVTVDDNCLLALVVDAEVLGRRGDPLRNALNTLLDWLDLYFGYNAATSSQLVNLEIYSPLDSISDLLFKDTTVGLTEPSMTSTHDAARNYVELFRHLEACTGSATPGPTPLPGFSTRNIYSLITITVMSLITRFVL